MRNLKLRNFCVLIVLILSACMAQKRRSEPAHKMLVSEVPVVEGENFTIPATQEIFFVDQVNSSAEIDKLAPKVVDLTKFQTPARTQGSRGACIYFTVAALIESYFLRHHGRTVDLSEEHLAWSSKKQLGMRVREEDSSVAVTALAAQKFGVLEEKYLPYEESWLDRKPECNTQNKSLSIPVECYSHDSSKIDSALKFVINPKLKFIQLKSRTSDIVNAIAKYRAPMNLSIKGHPAMWQQSWRTGRLELNPLHKKECMTKRAQCSGHAVVLVGYDLDRRVFKFKNSWGSSWGKEGFGEITFDYVDQMSDRFHLMLL